MEEKENRLSSTEPAPKSERSVIGSVVKWIVGILLFLFIGFVLLDVFLLHKAEEWRQNRADERKKHMQSEFTSQLRELGLQEEDYVIVKEAFDSNGRNAWYTFRLNRADCPWEYHAEQTNEPGGLRFDYYPLQRFAGENAEMFFQSFSDRLKRNVADSGSTILAQYDFKPESLMLAYSWGDVTFQVADGKLSSAGCSLQPVSTLKQWMEKEQKYIENREEWMKDVYVVSCTVSVTANVTEEFREELNRYKEKLLLYGDGETEKPVKKMTRTGIDGRVELVP